MRAGDELTETIERLPAFEERAGVTLDNCSAYVTSYSATSVKVAGEVLPATGTRLATDIEVIVSVYDDRGRVVGTRTQEFYRESFFGFDTFFMEYISIPAGSKVSKVRLFPRPS